MVFLFLKALPLLVRPVQSTALLHWAKIPGNPLMIEIQVSRRYHPDFWARLVLRRNRASELRIKQQPIPQLMVINGNS